MTKLIDEKVMQGYFLDNENWGHYEVEINGRMERIISVVKGEDFPDLECRITGVRGLVPCEVEWESSKFDHQDHPNWDDFRRRNGFLLVFRNDENVEDLQQIVVDEEHFKRWFRRNAANIFDEAVSEFKIGFERRRKNAKLWVVYIGSLLMQRNREIGIEHSTWGWIMTNPPHIIRQLQSIRKDDLFVMFGPTVNRGDDAVSWDGKPNKDKNIFARMPGSGYDSGSTTLNPSYRGYRDHIRHQHYEITRVLICRITRGYWNEEDTDEAYQSIWTDETDGNRKYPHRVRFQIKLELNDVRLRNLNDATNVFLRLSMQGVGVSEMSYQNLVELIRKELHDHQAQNLN